MFVGGERLYPEIPCDSYLKKTTTNAGVTVDFTFDFEPSLVMLNVNTSISFKDKKNPRVCVTDNVDESRFVISLEGKTVKFTDPFQQAYIYCYAWK